MKISARRLLAVFLFASGVFSLNAQDLIVLKDGNIIEAKVIEISPSEIRYKRFDHLDGPTVVVPAANVLSIRYENGRLDTINSSGSPPALPGGSKSVTAAPPEGQEVRQAGLPKPLQMILNALPAIPIAGNNLKFEFGDETWTAKVNGENFSAGTIFIENTDGGGLLTLKQTHIWPGAAGKTAGRLIGKIPGASAVGGAIEAAGTVAGALAGAVEAAGPEIILEYKAGPPAKLSFVRTAAAKDSAGQTSKNASGRSSGAGQAERNPRLNTLGVSFGSTFSAPAYIGTIHATLAPSDNSFFDLGMDLGWVDYYSKNNADEQDGQGYNDFVYSYDREYNYFSLYPFANFAAFMPFNLSGREGGWYAGAGFGLMFQKYAFNLNDLGVDEIWETVFAVNLVTGFNLFDVIDISYTLRTDFKTINGKLSLGYVYRFK
jgi:hypothetical protein